MDRTMISGFADEICNDLDGQISTLHDLGMRYICLRGVDGKNIADYTYEEAAASIVPRLAQANIRVSSIGSPIGKVFLDDADGIRKQLDRLRTLCRIAALLDCRYIRLFSFFIPKDRDPDTCDTEVLSHMRDLIAVCDEYGIIPLHENEKDIFGDTGARCRRLHDALRGTSLCAAFDFANFVQCGDDPWACYMLLRDEIEYVHIKDADAATRLNVLIGTGNGRALDILRDLDARGYHGHLTLEPHLVSFDSLKDIELDSPEHIILKNNAYPDGRAGFTAQYRALLGLLDQI